MTPDTASRSSRMRSTKSSALSAAKAASKRSTIAPSSPVDASSRNLLRSSVRRNNGSCGRKKLRGCGSKVSAAAGRCSAAARCRAVAMTAWWPRCTPSKLPIATTAPWSAWPAGASPWTTANAGVGFECSGMALFYVPGRPAEPASAGNLARVGRAPNQHDFVEDFCLAEGPGAPVVRVINRIFNAFC